MAWSKLDITPPDVGAEVLANIIDQLRALLEALVGILDVMLTFVGVLLDPFAAALEGLIDQIKAIVEQYLFDLGAYCLFVPIRKRVMTNFLGLGDITPVWAGEAGLFGAPTSPVAPTNPDLNQFLADANRYNGGNVGFFKTVIESLYDEGDTSRPQFHSPDDYVGGFVLVMGTDFDPLGFLDDIWKLSGLFGGPNLIPKVPRPTGLQARAIQGISGGKFSTLLMWDLLDTPIHTLPDLGGTVLVPERYAIMRGKNTTGSLRATSVVDLMGKRALKEGDEFTNGDMVVIKEDAWNITIGSHLDEDIKATEDDTFYYAVAWKLQALRKNEAPQTGAGETLDYWYISNLARVTPFPTLPASTPPDWVRTPTIASIFPELADLLQKLLAQIEAFSAKLLGAVDMLKDYVKFLKSEIARYERMVNDILDAVARLSFKFLLPDSGVYLRSFKGAGGNDFFVSDLAGSFLPSEKGRPPFTRGDEFVTGAVIMTGGPEYAVDSMIAGLSWVFGGPPDKTDLLFQLLGSAGATLSAIENLAFSDNMKKKNEDDPVPDDGGVFDVAMNPIEAKPEETPEFGKDMKVN